MPRSSDLTPNDEALLQARLLEYRTTVASQKEAFRVACAKYILRSRALDDSNELFVELFAAKVRNWFQNHLETRMSRLPGRLHQSFHPMRIFGHKNRDLIRTTVAKQISDGEVDPRGYLVQWNDTVRRLWDALPEEEQRPYIHLAQLWSIQGPDDDLKPWMAEKRSAPWFRAVSSMFWNQCGMPIFIYGMFKDTNGRLRATVYDTTELWADTDESTPQFRNVKGWDLDFRRKAWSFFHAIMMPGEASPETLQLVDSTRRVGAARFAFAFHSDGTPILTDLENGKTTLTLRRQQILREYLRIHYSHAQGFEARSVPWTSLHDVPQKFFAPGMLPAGFTFHDPSKIPDEDLIKLFKHIAFIESRPEHQDNRFKFSHYEIGPKDNHTYIPAVYSGSYTPAPARRTKKAVQVPGFEGPPSDTETDATTPSQPPPARPSGPKGPGGSRLDAALVTDFAKVKAKLAAEAAASPKDSPSPIPPAAPSPANAPAPSGKGKAVDREPWVEAEFHAPPADDDDWFEQDDDEMQEWDGAVSDDPTPLDVSFASDDEVEGVLDFVLSGNDEEVHAETADTGTGRTSPSGTPCPGDTHAPLVADGRLPRRPFQSPPTPNSVPQSGAARLAYLRALVVEDSYQGMLRALEAKLNEVTVIRGKAPVMWVTWGLASGHVPESIHVSEKNVGTLLKWITKGVAVAASAADVQRFCLAVGLLLSDLDFMDDTTGLPLWPENLPGYLVYSQLDPGHRAAVLKACDSVATLWGGSGSSGVQADDASEEMADATPAKGSAAAQPAPVATAAAQRRRGKSKARVGGLTSASDIPVAAADGAALPAPAAVARAPSERRRGRGRGISTTVPATDRVTRARSRGN